MQPEHHFDPPATITGKSISGNIPADADENDVPALCAVPIAVLIADAERSERLDREQADELLTEHQAEPEAAADAELAAEMAESAERLQEGEPPADLDVDTAGLPPQRARLVRFDAWLAAMNEELDRRCLPGRS